MKRSLTLIPILLFALTGGFYACQPDEVVPATVTPEIKSVAVAQALAEGCDILDFENAGGFSRDASGFLTSALSQKGRLVKINAFARHSYSPPTQWEAGNRANIVNTTNMPEDHPAKELETPDWSGTTPSLGNVLVAQELLEPPHNLASSPNDNRYGAKFEFDFSAIGPVTVTSLNVLDNEQHVTLHSRVDFYDAANNRINATDIPLPATVNGGVNRVTFSEMKGVVRMVVYLDGAWNSTTNDGTGAIDNIQFCQEIPQTPTCGPCAGNLNKLTLQYNGPDNGKILASTRVGFFLLPLLLDQDLDNGEMINLDGAKNLDKRIGFAGTLGNEVILVHTALNRVSLTKIITSCDKPIYEKYDGGMYTTVSASSKTGGPLCDFEPVPPQTCPTHSALYCYHFSF